MVNIIDQEQLQEQAKFWTEEIVDGDKKKQSSANKHCHTHWNSYHLYK